VRFLRSFILRRPARIAAGLAIGLSVLIIVPAAVPAAATRPSSALTAPVRTIRTALGTVDYRSLGRGRPLVMIMGLDGSIDAWPPGFVDALARRHRVYALDNEGIGLSTLRPGTLTISRMADDTAAFIAALHLQRPDVLGWSMGGFIAQALAVRHPQAYRRLILAATAPGTGHGVSPSGPVLKALTGNPAQLLTFLFPPDQSSWAGKYAAAIAKYPHLFLAPSAVDTLQLAASSRWISGGDRSGRTVNHIQRPVLIADGARDVILPSANSRLLHRLVKHSRLHLYPDAGHGFLFQDQAPFVRLIDRFLAAAAPPRG
jgi:pimeloyl-ACP methyl ester carboxylesterase